jgi:hypothetical protein
VVRVVQVTDGFLTGDGGDVYGLAAPTAALVADAASVVEGTDATYTVALSTEWDEPIQIDYATSNGTGTTADYTATSGTLLLLAKQTTGAITVPTTFRSGTQGSRTFTLTLSNGRSESGEVVTFTTAARTVTITDAQGGGDALPTLSVAAVAPADEGTPLSFRITASATYLEALSVAYATSDDTATAGVDYTATSGTATISVGQTHVDVPVTTALRPGVQGPRAVRLTISNGATAGGATLTLTTATVTGVIAETEVVSGDHALYEAMTGAPTAWKAISFRSQAEINLYSQGGVNTEMIYAPGADTHPFAQDAAKISIPAYEATSTVLTQDVAADATVIFVSAGQTDGRGLLLSAGTPTEEYVQVVNGNSVSGYTVTRGRYGTTPQAHTAATSVLRRSKNKLDSQIRLRLNTASNYSYFAAVDTFWTDSLMNVPNLTFKLFQFSSPGDRIWVEPRLVFSGGNAVSRPADWNASVYCGAVDVRTYEEGGGVVPWTPTEQRHGPGLVRVGQNMTPQVGRFGVKPNTWTRWLWKFEQVANDYDSFSFWMADETRDPVLIIDALPVNIGRGTGTDEIDRWWLEMDTSVEADIRGDLEPFVSYVRNFAINRGPLGTDWSAFLVRP